jgi:hypothetical protein
VTRHYMHIFFITVRSNAFLTMMNEKTGWHGRRDRLVGKFDDPFGAVVLYYPRGRRFNPRSVQTFVYMNMSVCVGCVCFLYMVYKKKVFKYVFIHLSLSTWMT